MNYITVTSPDINNGLGCRVTLWVAGCSNHCQGCQNPETWNYNQGKPLEDAYEKVSEELKKPYIIGLTFSGGDPLNQERDSLEELLRFILRIRADFPDKNIWVYTGNTYEELMESQNSDIYEKILSNIEYLVEGRYVQSLRDVSLPFKGSSNQRIMKLKDGKYKIVSKFPV